MFGLVFFFLNADDMMYKTMYYMDMYTCNLFNKHNIYQYNWFYSYIATTGWNGCITG